MRFNRKSVQQKQQHQKNDVDRYVLVCFVAVSRWSKKSRRINLLCCLIQYHSHWTSHSHTHTLNNSKSSPKWLNMHKFSFQLISIFDESNILTVHNANKINHTVFWRDNAFSISNGTRFSHFHVGLIALASSEVTNGWFMWNYAWQLTITHRIYQPTAAINSQPLSQAPAAAPKRKIFWFCSRRFSSTEWHETENIFIRLHMRFY